MILLWKLRIMRSWNTVSPIHATHNNSTQLISAQIDCWLFGGNCVRDPGSTELSTANTDILKQADAVFILFDACNKSI